MSKLVVNDLKRGDFFQKDGTPFEVIDITMHTPSARGANMMVKIRCKNTLTYQVLDLTFKGGDMVDEADFERRSGQFLYSDGEDYIFMDLNTYEQHSLDSNKIGDKSFFLIEGIDIILYIFKGNLVDIELPLVVEQKIVECEPVIKGGTAAAQSKTAVTETGLTIQVPSYMKEGEMVKIDTTQKRYIGRA